MTLSSERGSSSLARVLKPLEMFLHVESASGAMLLFAAVCGPTLRGAALTKVFGALSQATFVALRATIFLLFNSNPDVRAGWAIPTATDIAFAVGVLAMLGKA